MGEISIAYLDTHVLIWLYDGAVDRLTKPAKRAIEKSDVFISPASILELEILHEIGRRRSPAKNLVSALQRDIGLQICNLPFHSTAVHATGEAWTRDPFDRLIVANAKAANASLITADSQIRRHYARAIW